MLWKILIPIVASALIAWGAWATIGVTSSTPRAVHDKHVDDFNAHKEKASEKFEKVLEIIREQSERIEDKLDDIQEKL